MKHFMNKKLIINCIHSIVVLIGLHNLLNYFYRKRRFYKIPILIYHSIGEEYPSPYNISANAFERQMRYLYDNHNIIPLRDLLSLEKKNNSKYWDKKLPLLLNNSQEPRMISYRAVAEELGIEVKRIKRNGEVREIIDQYRD